MQSYRDLIVWQKADELAFQIYKVTEHFPKTETFGIMSQLRRAALSVPTNIVEGHGRASKKEFAHFLDISIGSLAETEYLLYFAKRLGYPNPADTAISQLLTETQKLLWSFKKALKRGRAVC